MFKKIIVSIILASFLLLNVGGNVALAQNTWYFQDFGDWYDRVYEEDNPDEIFGERYTAAQVEWVIYGLFGFILNHIIGNTGMISCIIEYGDNPIEFGLHCGDDLISTIIGWISDGLLGNNDLTNSNIASHKNPLEDILSGERPISGIGYLRNAASKFSLAPEVSAQGFGFEAASSIRTVWVAVRNLAYFLLVLLILAMSFMIMFRFKISPQTVITVQSALPKIIIALLLITFSYAIAGFMIDLLYVVIGIIAAVLSQSGLFTSPNDTWIGMYNDLAGVGFGQGIFGVMILYLFLFIIIAFFALFSNLGAIILLPVTLLIYIITIVVALIAVFIILLKIIWILVKTFVMTLLLIAAGPIFIIFGGFMGWIKNLASHLAVFAAIGPMLAIAMLFLGNALPDMGSLPEPIGPINVYIANLIPFDPDPNVLENSTWLPPFLPFGRDLDVVWLFASFVIITLIPNVANIIKGMIQGRPFGYGTAVGAALGAAAAVPTAYFGPQMAATRDTWAKNRAENITRAIGQSKYGQALKGFIGR